MNKKALETLLIHGKPVPNDAFKSQHVPVCRGSSVFFENTQAQRAPVDALGLDYSYGLHGNPTQYTLSKKLAEIEGANYALVCPSGLAAISLLVQACLKSGDHWLIPSNVYGPTRLLAKTFFQDYGVAFDEYDANSLETLKAKLRSNTRLVWVEAPGSLTFEVPDIQTIVNLAKKQGARLAIDNTWSAGIAFKPFDFQFDYSVQALTKYQSGHADVLMGAVLCHSDSSFELVESKNRILGLGVSPSDCELVLRGLLTLPLRYKAQAKSALTIAKALQQNPWVNRVLYPALPDAPGHEQWKKYFSGSASVFSFVLNPSIDDARACAWADRLELFKTAYSWGGPTSLVLIAQLPSDRLQYFKVNHQACGPLVRLAIGLEDPQDLLDDINTAFDQVLTQSTK